MRSPRLPGGPRMRLPSLLSPGRQGLERRPPQLARGVHARARLACGRCEVTRSAVQAYVLAKAMVRLDGERLRPLTVESPGCARCQPHP